MFACRFLIQFIVFLQLINGDEQICYFRASTRAINGYNGPTKELYECQFNKVELPKEFIETVTSTFNNLRTNDEVTSVWYRGVGTMKSLSNSIFTTFLNMEYFYISNQHGFEVIKPHFLKSANNLTVFWIENNILSNLRARLFVYAPQLQYINLQSNKIRSIHRLTFNGLSNLKGVYLKNNQLSNLHPGTFSPIIHLKVLDLLGNVCLDSKYEDAHSKSNVIEEEISRFCDYDLTRSEMQKILKDSDGSKTKNSMVEDQQLLISSLIQVNANLVANNKLLQENLKALTVKV